jgi:uncharacterized protein
MGPPTAPPTGLPPRSGLFRLITVMAGLPLLLGATATGNGSIRPVPPDVMERESQTEPIDTSWRTLLGLDYRTGEITEELENRRGQVVRIPGFMVPFEDGLDGVTEFLLVPYFGACIHTPPPPPNQMVYVQMDQGRTVDVNIWDAIWIEGTFEIEDIDSAYGSVGYKVTGDRIRPYRGDE